MASPERLSSFVISPIMLFNFVFLLVFTSVIDNVSSLSTTTTVSLDLQCHFAEELSKTSCNRTNSGNSPSEVNSSQTNANDPLAIHHLIIDSFCQVLVNVSDDVCKNVKADKEVIFKGQSNETYSTLTQTVSKNDITTTTTTVASNITKNPNEEKKKDKTWHKKEEAKKKMEESKTTDTNLKPTTLLPQNITSNTTSSSSNVSSTSKTTTKAKPVVDLGKKIEEDGEGGGEDGKIDVPIKEEEGSDAENQGYEVDVDAGDDDDDEDTSIPKETNGKEKDFSFNEPSNSRPRVHPIGTFSSGYEDGDSHFFIYFLTVVGMCITMYVLFHNKQKILAIIVEGRKDQRSRRPNSNLYRKLDTNLDEVIQDNRPKNLRSMSNVIY